MLFRRTQLPLGTHMAAHVYNFRHRESNAILGLCGYCTAMVHRHTGRKYIYTYKFILQKQRSQENKKKARQTAFKAETTRGEQEVLSGAGPVTSAPCPLFTHLQAAHSAILSLLLNNLLEMSILMCPRTRVQRVRLWPPKSGWGFLAVVWCQVGAVP